MLRGEIWHVQLNPYQGDEMFKLRPVVVVSTDGLATLNLRVVVPITGWQPDFVRKPYMVQLHPSPANGLSKISAADCFQIRCVSGTRFSTRLGVVSAAELDDILAAIAIVVGF
jgi:mRNA interferase MazF